jgi:1-acyl-sn-glycerol-3-phosphate acyltransferase
MWLLPLFSPLSRAAAAIYYRVQYAGEPVPAHGPVLLVANHPNSLLDPMLVVAAARRGVRFLAKAPLFSDRKIAWLVRAAGSIPVYRRSDDPTQMNRNEDAFRAVYAALAEGSAVGIFPEGTSHSAPGLAPIRTGAARIALGAHATVGASFPIVPVGLVHRRKDEFRSDAIVLTGAPVRWDDLGPRGVADADAVRELTARIDQALRQLTLNLERWEDRPLVECAVRVWEAESGAMRDPAARLARLEVTTRILAEVRARGDDAGEALAGDVAAFERRLARLQLRPADLTADVKLSRGVRWTAQRLHLLMPLAAIVGAIGAAAFWVPYRLTGRIMDRLRVEADVRSTWKLLVGIVLYLLWIVGLASLAGIRFGAVPATATLVGLPLVGVIGLYVRERWRAAWQDARRFFLIRSRRELVDSLRRRQKDLAVRLDALYTEYAVHTERPEPT